MDRTPAQRALILAAAGAGIALIIGYGIPVCPSATILGIPCPGCGLTRATLAALHGDLELALRFHPLFFLLTPLFLYLAGNAAYGYVRGAAAAQTARQRSLWTSRATTVAGSAVVALVFTVWVLRFFGYFGGPAPVQTLRAEPAAPQER